MLSGRKYQTKGVHTGSLIRKKMAEMHISNSELARRISRSPSTTTAYYLQSSIQTAVLLEICVALNHNFFTDLDSALPEHLKQISHAVTATKTTEENAELSRLREENTYLKKMIDVFATKVTTAAAV